MSLTQLNHERNKNFIDYVKIFIKSGDGGNGSVSFRRERFVPKGGPDGGDGGRGGHVIVEVSPHLTSLYDFLRKRHFKAKNGRHGSGRQKTGAQGSDLVLTVPMGTIIRREDTGELVGEYLNPEDRHILQEGGKGGLGNVHFKSSVRQAPQKATPGKKTEGMWLILELKILADVGIVGAPNAGKSSLLSAITRAHSKVGNYPFTTLHPKLGVIDCDKKRIKIADLPGLVEGAHEGVGLGSQFLKHVERTRILLYLIELYPDQTERSLENLEMIEREVSLHQAENIKKPRMLVFNKTDLVDTSHIEALRRQLTAKYQDNFFFISTQSQEGLTELKKALCQHALALTTEPE